MEATAQPMQALANANRIRVERGRQRRELRGRDFRRIVPAVVNPTPEFATYRLDHLFAGSSPLIRGINTIGLRDAMQEASGYRSITADLRLGDLTERERRRLMRSLRDRSPRGAKAA